MFKDYVLEWLDAALDIGIKEPEFWAMSFAEVDRAVRSRNRVKEQQERERAAAHYILADLIGRSVSRVYNSANKMPPISEVYPTLFTSEEEQEAIQAKRDELSALRFKMFAQSYNAKNKEVAKDS